MALDFLKNIFSREEEPKTSPLVPYGENDIGQWMPPSRPDLAYSGKKKSPYDVAYSPKVAQQPIQRSGDFLFKGQTETFNLTPTPTGIKKLEPVLMPEPAEERKERFRMAFESQKKIREDIEIMSPKEASVFESKVVKPFALTGLGLVDIPLEAVDFIGDALTTTLRNITFTGEAIAEKVGLQTESQTKKDKQKWISFWEEVKKTNPVANIDEIVDEFQRSPALQPTKEWQEAPLTEKLTKRLPETILGIGPSIISSMGQFALSPSFGLVAIAGSTANDVKDMAIDNGVTEEKATLLGASVGILVSWLERIVPNKIFSNQGIKNQFIGGFAKRLAETSILEVGTEITQEAIQVIAELTFRDIGFNELATRTALSGLGGLLGGVGSQTVVSFANETQRRDILKSLKVEEPERGSIRLGEPTAGKPEVEPTAIPKELELFKDRIKDGKITLYHGTKRLDKTTLLEGDFLSESSGTLDRFGNAGAKDYAGEKGKVIKFELSIEDVKFNPSTGEFQFIGKTEQFVGGKYSEKIYRAFNEAEGSNFTMIEIDKMSLEEVRSSASMALKEGRIEFDQATAKAVKAPPEPLKPEVKAEPKETLEDYLEGLFKKERPEIERAIEKAESEVLTTFEQAEAGERVMVSMSTQKEGAKFVRKPSTFPDWIPENLRKKPILNAVANHLRNNTQPNNKFVRQRELYDLTAKRILNLAGLSDEQIDAVMKFASPERIVEKEIVKEKIVEKSVIRKIIEVVEKKPKVPKFKEAKEGATEVVKERREIEKGLPRKFITPKEAAVKIRSAKEKGKAIGRIEARKEILDQLRIKGEQIQGIKKQITDYTKANLPTSQRGKALIMVRDATTQKDLIKAFTRIDSWADDFAKKAIRNDIFKTYKRVVASPSIAVDYKEKIKDLINTIELKGHTKRTISKLEQTKKFIDEAKARGEQVELPIRIIKALEILSRKPFEQVSLSELENLRTEIDLLEQLGKTKFKTFKALYENEKALMKEAIISGTKSIDKIPEITASVGEELTKTDKIRNILGKSINEFRRIDKVILPMDVIFDMLDGAKSAYMGANSLLIKGKLDYDYGNYLTLRNELEKPVVDLVEKKNITEKQLDRIGFYAAKVQENGVEKLVALGYSESYIKNFTLTSAEMSVYTEMRKTLDELRPKIAELMRVVYNQPVGKVENYFSFLTDWDAMSESEVFQRVGDGVDEFGRSTKQTEKGFTKSRTDIKGTQKIRLDALGIFRRHIDNATYLIEVSRDIKMAFEIINSPEYKEAAGDTGQLLALEWIDLMARKGGAMGATQVRLLDMLRKNMGMATLGFKISSTLIQPTSILNGAGYIGQWAFKGAKDIATNEKWREFVMKFPEIEARVGDDPAFLDFQGKAGGLAFWGLQKLDSLAASSVAAGAYRQKMHEMNKQLDFNVVNKKAMEYAQWVVRKSQASMFFKDLPLAISRGSLTGNRSVDKAIFQFQTFVLNNWATIRYDMAELGIRAETRKERLGAANKLLWLLISSAAATGLRMGANKIVDFLSGEEDKEDDEFKKKMMWDLIGNIPFLGQLISVLMYGGNAIPSLEFLRTANRATQRLKSRTPSTKKKGVINLFETFGQLLGAPGSAQISDILEGRVKEDKVKVGREREEKEDAKVKWEKPRKTNELVEWKK